MFWVDEIAQEISRTFSDKKEIIIRDEKTASGRVHVGSLRGVVIHGVIAQALNRLGRDATFIYEINDVDPMDGMPVYLDRESYLPHMGKPLKDVPPPGPDGKPQGPATPIHNFARVYGQEFLEVIAKLGFKPKIIWASDCYASGLYDEWIVRACEKPEKIREIYQRISGSDKGEEWNPLQIVCENCGKVGTTIVTQFDGKEAVYSCEPHKVTWAIGCGHKGKTSPFKGRGKLPWKVEWAVKWAGLKVDVEGAGKDHNAAGGSHDVSSSIAKEALGTHVPFNIPYEFFLFGGAKMSASKGLGATAKEAAELMPPELLRFLMTRSRPNQPIDFSIDGETIPRLYDNHDECGESYFGRKEKTADLDRAFYYAQLDPEHIQDRYLPRFSRVAFAVQIPHLDVVEEVTRMKGAPLTAADTQEAHERIAYAKKWLADFAPASAKFVIQEKIPQNAAHLSPDQKEFLKNIAALLKNDTHLSGEELHGKIHEQRKSSPLQPREGFSAIYMALLGKDSGPQAGWFLESLDRTFLIERFEKVAALASVAKKEIEDRVTPYVVIHKEVLRRFPEIKVAFGALRGVKIVASHADLPSLQATLWEGLDFEELKKNSPRLEAFREIYRGFGVKPTTHKPSPVALISRLANGKSLPSINLAVDIANTIAVKCQLAVRVFDAQRIQLPVQLRFAQGGEKFRGLSMDKEVPLMPGELCYFDASGLTLARDMNYLDAQQTKVTDQTTELLLNIDGNEAVTQPELEKCLEELTQLLQKYCGGTSGTK